MSDFCPSIWPEEPTPSTVKNCGECGLIEHGSRMIWGEGNPTAPIMVILDNPGARENRNSDPFVCGTRQTLQKATTTVGLNANDLYFKTKTNPRIR
ncbi:uracil-DNA glycosylase family protein [Lentibacillus sp. Marseille-P4043]|uniref:uracil-DNA glycosylase family protein n=1 Tax=Lentibacillus sp. Marseille-P4043 TaxID=2040293 RepID=UPI001F1BB76A|nr:uracil-DNA glycosylase family protein [Lentibacillus sp. Marseille-P4043]